MALDAIAPWAGPVLATVDDVLARDDDGWSYELVPGFRHPVSDLFT